MRRLLRSSRSSPRDAGRRPLPRLHAQTPALRASVFSDVTSASGIAFRHTNGAFGKKYLPETMGSGVAFFDFDGDGRRTSSSSTPRASPGRAEKPGLPALYRNDGKGRFTDVTKAAGLAVEMYGLGAAAADYDNDGRVDLYVTGLGPNHLFRNLGGGKFADVTAKAGVGDPGFSTSAMFFDYDKDGRLDLFVANYVDLVDREGPLLHARRQEQVLLHARVLQGPEPPALPQPRGTASSRTPRRRPGSRTRAPRRSAWRCSTSTATAGPTSSSPTTPSPTSSTGTTATAPSATSAWPRASPSARPASRARAWASDAADYERQRPAVRS